MTAKRVEIVGGGPSGLSAAITLKRLGVAEVIVHEREPKAGGVPRHTEHLGFGIRDLHRVMSGPRYAARLVEMALAARVDLRLESTVFERPDCDALIVATGVRERPRSARLVPGDRPAGILTTGALQQLVQRGFPVGRRALIVGAEHVSFSAIMTLSHGGCRAVGLVTNHDRHQTYPPLKWMTATRHRVPVITGTDVEEIRGHGRVAEVALSNGQVIACDTVVFTGGWIPENELARHMGVALALDYPSPVIDEHFATSLDGVFAVGNVAHRVKSADSCAVEGQRAARAVTAYLVR